MTPEIAPEILQAIGALVVLVVMFFVLAGCFVCLRDRVVDPWLARRAQVEVDAIVGRGRGLGPWFDAPAVHDEAALDARAVLRAAADVAHARAHLEAAKYVEAVVWARAHRSRYLNLPEPADVEAMKIGRSAGHHARIALAIREQLGLDPVTGKEARPS